MTQHIYGGEKVWWKIRQSPFEIEIAYDHFCQFWFDPPPPIVLLYGAPFPHHFRAVPPPLLLSVRRTGIQLVFLMNGKRFHHRLY